MIKKSILLAILLLIIPSIGWCGSCDYETLSCSGSTPWMADSVEYDDVNYCVNTCASPGDTVNLPSGTVSWDNQLTITEAITLQGTTTCTPTGTVGTGGYSISCDDSTKITAGSELNNYLIRIRPNTPADNPKITISGLALDGNNQIGKGGGFNIINSDSTGAVPLTNIRIHHCKIENMNSFHGVLINNMVYGLVDHVHFHNIGDNTHHSYVFRYDGDCDMWSQPYPDYGSTNFFFFENNYVTEMGYILNNSGTGARWVWRYNVLDITVTHGVKVFDLHEDVSNCGGIAAEIYENPMVGILDGPVQAFAQLGMSQIVYNNMTGGNQYRTDITLGWTQTTCVNYTNPEWQAYTENTYIWNNVYSGTGYPVSVKENDVPECFEEDRDYWDDSGGEGVYTGESPYSADPKGYGNFWYDIASSRALETCADDDVYWETDNKKLYRCVGDDNWALIYQPYVYPHPLRSSDAITNSDVDNSGSITTIDALLTLRNSLGLSMTGTAWRVSSTTGDVNCDGDSNSTDALLILRYSLGLSMSETGWCE